MRYSFFFFTLLLLLVGCQTRTERTREEEFDVIFELIARIKKDLPKGWDMALSKYSYPFRDTSIHSAGVVSERDYFVIRGYYDLEIYRKKRVDYSEQDIPNDEVLDEPIPDNFDPDNNILGFTNSMIFFLSLNVRRPYLTPEAFEKLKSRNNEIKQKMKEYASSLKDVHRHGKARAYEPLGTSWYFPKTPDHKRRVAEFKEYCKKNKIVRLPHYHFKGISFWLEDPRRYTSFDKEVDADCALIISRLKKILNEY